jgi:hypothetical protein
MTAMTTESATDWTDGYQRYLASSARNGAIVRELYAEIIDRVARGELSQHAIEERSPAFVQAFAIDYANELAEVSVRFLTGIVASGTIYTQEIVDRFAPDLVALPDIRPPVPEAADWVTWLQRFAQFADQHHRARTEMLRVVMERVAAGEVEPLPTGAPASPDQLPASARDMLSLYFDLLTGLDEVTTRFATRYLSTLLGERRGDDFVLRLRGTVGTIAKVRFAVRNTQTSDTSVRCVISDVRRQDGVGPAFVPDAALTPERFDLTPGEERAVTLAVNLAPDRFEAGRRYVGTLQVLSPEGTLLTTSVHVEPASPAAVGPGAEPATTATDQDQRLDPNPHQ